MVTQKLTQNQRSSFRQATLPWLVVLTDAFFFFFIFIHINMPNSISPALAQEFHIGATILASISGEYFLGVVLFLIPAGMLLDQFSVRKLVLFAMILSILCTFGFAAATAVWQMQVIRFIVGVVGSFCLLSVVRLASRWFPPHKMALVIGLSVTIAMLGGMIAQRPLASLIEMIGWRHALYCIGGLGALLLIPMFLLIHDFPKGKAQQDAHISLRGRAFWRALATAACKPQNFFAAFYTSLMNLSIFIFGAMWGIFYLTQTWHLSTLKAANIISFLFIGMIVGSPFVGWLSDRLRRRKAPMIVGAILSLGVILILMYVPHLTVGALYPLFFLIGFLSSAQIISYPLIAESNPRAITATAESFSSMIIMAGGYVQLLFAYLIQLHWNHSYANSQPIYSSHDYHLGLMILPISFIISLILAICIKETRCLPYEEKL